MINLKNRGWGVQNPRICILSTRVLRGRFWVGGLFLLREPEGTDNLGLLSTDPPLLGH